MKVLFLSQGNNVSDQLSFHLGFEHAKETGQISGFTNIPYRGYIREHGWQAFTDHVYSVCTREDYDVVFFQFFHGKPIGSPRSLLKALKKLGAPPLIACSYGDLAIPFWRSPGQEFIELAQEADVTFLTSMGKFARYLSKRNNVRRIMLMPHAFSNVAFQRNESVDENFDVVFVGSRCNLLTPTSYIPSRLWYAYTAAKRTQIVNLLYRRYGKRLGLFGHGWNGHPAWHGPIPFKEQRNTFLRGRLVVDARPPFLETYYASDRPFYVAGSGVPLAQRYTPRFEKMFPDNQMAYYYYQDEDVLSSCDRVLDTSPEIIASRLEQTMAEIQSKHLIDHRVRDIIITCDEIIRSGRTNHDPSLCWRIPLNYFASGVCVKDERPYAMINW